ncbi:MAG: efflux RND transporter periplasmic adaptor subunit [Bdellovibrionales bacterium]
MRYWLAIFFGLISVAPAGAATTTPTVVVRPSKQVEIGQALTYPAAVKTRVQATVLAEADGVVRRIHAQLGQPVTRGRRVLTVQQTDPVFQYAPAATIAPVSGIVSELFVTEGALVTKGQKLATVTDPASLRILVEVPAKDVSLLRSGLLGKLEIPSFKNPVDLKVVGVSPVVDPATGTATAELLPANSEQVKTLRPGMIGKVTFKANLHHGFLVPEDAVVQAQDKNFVRLVIDGKAHKQEVSLGERLRGQVEIVDGLKEGDLVVERSSGFVADGDEVKVENAEGKAL